MSVECFCLTKRYGRRVVLDDVSLEINDGGVTGLIGPNGAGKSTLIKLITGLIWPTEGFVLVDGFDAHREHTKAMRRIGAVIEWPAFIPDLSARANLDIFSGGHGRAYREKCAEILRFMELESVLDRKVGSFSTGMRQRLGITLALLPDSEFIILDEPTNGLDPAGIVEIRQIIREYNRQFGVSVMVSSHLLSEVEQICDHLILIDGGRLKAWGEIGELLDSRPRLRLRTDRPESAAALLRRAVAGNVLPPCGIENGPDGILLELGESCAGAVNRLLVENGFNITHLAVERQTLENFFLKETAGDNGHA